MSNEKAPKTAKQKTEDSCSQYGKAKPGYGKSRRYEGLFHLPSMKHERGRPVSDGDDPFEDYFSI